MVQELAELLPGFEIVNHTRCFLHINNLVARSVVRQFDVPKKAPTDPESDDPAERELQELAEDIEQEDCQTREALLEEMGTNEVENDDLIDGWVDEMAALSQSERAAVQKSVQPVRKMLVKASFISSKDDVSKYTDRKMC